MLLIEIEAEARFRSTYDIALCISGINEKVSQFLFHQLFLPYWVHVLPPSMPDFAPYQNWLISASHLQQWTDTINLLWRLDSLRNFIKQQLVDQPWTLGWQPMKDCYKTVTFPFMHLNCGGVGFTFQSLGIIEQLFLNLFLPLLQFL